MLNYKIITQNAGVACSLVLFTMFKVHLQFVAQILFFFVCLFVVIFFFPVYKKFVLKGVVEWRDFEGAQIFLTGQLGHHSNRHLQIRIGLLSITEELFRFLFSRRYDWVYVWINSTLCKQMTFILNTREIYMY